MNITGLFNLLSNFGDQLQQLSQTALDHMQESELAQSFMEKASEIGNGLSLLGGSLANDGPELAPATVTPSGPDIPTP